MQPVAGQLNAASTALAQAGVDTATVMTPAATAGAIGAFKFPSLAMIANGGLASLLVSHDGAGAVLQTGDLWEIRDTAGAGLHGGFGQRTSLFSAAGLELRGLTGAAGGPAFVPSAAGDAHVSLYMTSTTAAGLKVYGVAGLGSPYDMLSVVNPSGNTVYLRVNNAGRVGIANQGGASNSLLAVGNGTGSLTDNATTNGPMGLKVRVDTTTAGANDGIQANLNVIAGTVGSKPGRAILARLDNNDTSGSGDLVALWADNFTAVASNRNTWGANIYNALQAPNIYLANQFNYTRAGIGAEIGVQSFAYNSADTSTVPIGIVCTIGSSTVTLSTDVSGGYTDGAPITCSAFPAGTTILSGSGTNTLTLSANATASGTVQAQVGARANYGGPVHLVTNGTNAMRYGLCISAGGQTSNLQGVNAASNIQHFIMATDETPPSGAGSGYRGPSVSLLYFGPMLPGNIPFGTPKTVVDKWGWLGLGMWPSAAPAYVAGLDGKPGAIGGLAVAGPGYFGSTLTVVGATQLGSLAVNAGGGLVSQIISHDGAGAALQSGDLWEIRDTAGSGIHGGFGQRATLFGQYGLELRGQNGAAAPSFTTSAASDPHVALYMASTTSVGLQIYGIANQATDFLRVASNAGGSTVYLRVDKSGHLGVFATPTNAFLYVGNGTGTLTDNVAGSGATAAYMGGKFKINTTAAGCTDALQANLNVIAGTAGSASGRGLIARVDNGDATGTGDLVAVWGDIFTTISGSKHNTWGQNVYNVLGAPGVYTANQLIYSAAGVGAEIGLSSFALNPNDTSTITFAGTLTNGSTTVTGVTAIGGYTNTVAISGAGIPSGTTVVSGAGTATITLSQQATADGRVLLTVSPQANVGGTLHLVNTGTNPVRYALCLGSGGNPSNAGGGNASNNVQHFILAADDTQVGNAIGGGPGLNYIYFGPLGVGNVPTGAAPRFVVDRFGWLGLGMAPSTSPTYGGSLGTPGALGGLAVAAPGYFASTLTVAGATSLSALAVTGPAIGLDQFFTHRSYGQVSTLPYLLGTTNLGVTSGTIYAAVIYPKQAVTSSSVQFMTGSTAPSGLTACYVGVYKADGTLLAQSDNMASAVTAANQLVTATFTTAGAFTLAASTAYYLAVVIVGTTTPGIGGTNIRSGALGAKVLPNAGNAPALTKTASGYSSGTLPSLTTAGTNVVPYIEVL